MTREITIDEVIKALKWFLEYNEEDYCAGDRFQDEYGDWFYKVSERDFKAFRQAADTMRKYQKIQEIIDDYEGEGWERIAISDIREVMDDGNDNSNMDNSNM